MVYKSNKSFISTWTKCLLSAVLTDEPQCDHFILILFADTMASLRPLRPLWPGHYKVALIIQDQQGLACPEPQLFELRACSCAKGEMCQEEEGRTAARKDTSSTFAAPGIAALILGFLALLCEYEMCQHDL